LRLDRGVRNEEIRFAWSWNWNSELPWVYQNPSEQLGLVFSGIEMPMSPGVPSPGVERFNRRQFSEADKSTPKKVPEAETLIEHLIDMPASMNPDTTPIVGLPAANLNRLSTRDDQLGPRLPNAERRYVFKVHAVFEGIAISKV
jgi:hypothetical protein